MENKSIIDLFMAKKGSGFLLREIQRFVMLCRNWTKNVCW